MTNLPLISVVMPVYNKAGQLHDTLWSLDHQDGKGTVFNLCFELVDDASTDDSARVAHDYFVQQPERLQYLRCEENAGPAIRTNMAVAMARGDLVLIFDADDIAPANSVLSLLTALRDHKLDYVYGRSARTQLSWSDAWSVRLPAGALKVSDEPLRFKLSEKIVHPVVLTSKRFYVEAGGASEDIFIQDESMAIRLALHGRRAGLLDTPCRYVLMLPGQSHLSQNKSQQHHDQYLAFSEGLARLASGDRLRAEMAGRCMSAWWKSARVDGLSLLPLYLLSRVFPTLIHRLFSQHAARYFNALKGVRRVNAGAAVQRGEQS